jgi:putative aldouronate transport system substrate-binding protein
MKTFCISVMALWLVLCPAVVYSGGGSQGTSAAISADDFNAAGYPIVKKPVTLRVIASKHDATRDYPDLPVFQELEKKTGVHIEWEYAGVDWATQKPLVLASGDLPDIFYGSTLGENDVLSNQGLFVQLDPLIEKYGENLRKIFQADATMANLARAYDGKVWGLPLRQGYRPKTFPVWMINQHWLDRVGQKMPTTTEELYTVLKAFKTGDPNGNGIADEIPWSFTFTPSISGPMDIFGAFGVVIDSTNEGYLTVTNDKVQYAFAQEGFQDGVAYLRRLYAEGLIDQEVFTFDYATWKARALQIDPEIVGMFGQWGREAFVGEERAAYHPLVMPMKGPRGYQSWSQNPEVAEYGKFRAEITASCKNPEVAFRWIDALYDEKTSLEIYLGADNLDWQSDGRIRVIEGGNDKWVYSLGDLCGVYVTDSMNSRLIFTVEESMIRDKERLSQYFPREYFPYGTVSMRPEESDELAILRTDIQSFALQQTAKWISEGGVEREYTGFVRQLNNMGLPRMIEIYQGIYNRYMGK